VARAPWGGADQWRPWKPSIQTDSDHPIRPAALVGRVGLTRIAGRSVCGLKVVLNLLDTHENDGVSVLKCGPESGYFIDCELDSFDQSARVGLIRSPSFFGHKNNIVIKESGAHSQPPI
jgi:hypothetical protein